MTDDRTTRASTVRVESAVGSQSAFGLYPASDFRLTDGRCRDCPTIPQALWYFQQEIIAVAKAGRADAEYPPLVWVASPEVVRGARLSADATALEGAGFSRRASLVPKIALNRSYFDATSAEFFAHRTVKARGETRDGDFVLRTLWPEDFRLDRVPPPAPLSPIGVPPWRCAPSPRGGAIRAWDGPARSGNAAPLLRALVRGEPQGGARSPFATSTLWQRDPAREAVPPGRAVLAIMLNGAQGDDDEAHAGHFALVTGRTQEDGGIGDWLVNNFYALDSESEKGILAAPVPLDNYLADLNSGQGWYRPSQMLVLVLASDRAATLVQTALNRTYNQFWRHQLPYGHATMNCAGISVDVLRALGWAIPARGPTSRIAAGMGFPLFVAKERSVAKARIAFDYLVEDQTRLMPAAAFEECGAAALALAVSGAIDASDSGRLARMLAEDIDAIAYIRFPQFPSSRAFGDFPVATAWEFQARMPSDRRLAQIIPVPPRPFPASLRDPDLASPPRPASDYAVAVWGALLVIGIVVALFFAFKQWFNLYHLGWPQKIGANRVLDNSFNFDNIGNMEHTNAVTALGALAHDHRLAVVRLLLEHAPIGLPAGVIGERLGLAPATLSFHLKELARTGLVTARPDGRFIWYRADVTTMNGLVAYLTENCCRAYAATDCCVPTTPKPRIVARIKQEDLA